LTDDGDCTDNLAETLMLTDRVKNVTDKATMFARVVARTGIWQDINAKGLLGAVRTLALGGSGPSAIFRIHGRNAPHKIAFEFRGRAWTYGGIDRRIDRLAAGVRAKGIGRGDRVLAILKNSPEVFGVNSAMSRMGAGAVSGSWRSTPRELEYLLRHSGAKAVFFEAELAESIEALCALAELPKDRAFSVNGEVDGFASLDSILREPPETEGAVQEGTVIIYTSGTTGKPKGAVRKFATGQIEGFFSFIHETPMRANDRHLVVCPMYHSTGLGFAGMALMLGGTCVIERDFEPEKFLSIIERERITTAAIVPTMLHRLMALPDEAFRKTDLRGLRAVFCGGAQLPGALGTRALDRLGDVLYNFYGATETGLVTVAGPQELRRSPGTIGHGVPGTEIVLLDEGGKPVPRGSVGELYARNAMLVAGYHADDDATQSSMRDGFFSVGDLATLDEHGCFHIVGRKRDMVISGGVNVYPVEVEECIAAHEAVAQAAVIGVEDSEWGERLRAFVVLRSGVHVNAGELKAFVRERLSGPKVPREWVFLEHLPSNPTGKVLKRELRDWAGDVERC
jgi:fatty-acyl-CoA synthase